MQKIECTACHASEPMRGSFGSARGQCGRTEQSVASRPGGTVPAGSITRLVDATVCAKCEATTGRWNLAASLVRRV
jgi:hypothetical protein